MGQSGDRLPYFYILRRGLRGFDAIIRHPFRPKARIDRSLESAGHCLAAVALARDMPAAHLLT